MPTRLRNTPDPPRILTPAASDHAIRTRYTGMRAIVGRPKALSREAITRGKSVYPIIQTDWKNELSEERKH